MTMQSGLRYFEDFGLAVLLQEFQDNLIPLLIKDNLPIGERILVIHDYHNNTLSLQDMNFSECLKVLFNSRNFSPL